MSPTNFIRILMLFVLLSSVSSADNSLGFVSEIQPIPEVRLVDSPPMVTHLLTRRQLIPGDIVVVLRGAVYKGDAEILSVSDNVAKIRCLDQNMVLEKGDFIRFARAGRASVFHFSNGCWCGSPLTESGGCWSTTGVESPEK